MKHKVLFVDDELSILRTIERIFKDSNYKVLTANSGEEAISILKDNVVSVIVSDMLMPGMNGVEFLKESMKSSPDSTRIVLSGYADSDTIIESIEKGHIWRYLTKPWRVNDLKVAIKNGVDKYEAIDREKMLVKALKIKSDMLVKMNESLEELVKERTYIIEKRTELLHMMLIDPDSVNILKRSVNIITELIGVNDIYILSGLLKTNIIGGNSNPISHKSISLFEKSYPSRCITPEVVYIPLLKEKLFLGALIFKSDSLTDSDIDKLEPIVTIIELILNQIESMKSVPELMDNLDTIVGEL